MKNTFRKGDTVKFTNSAADCTGVRRTTEEEIQAWCDSPSSKGITFAGETKLPPRDSCKRFSSNDTMTVVRGQARYALGYGNPRSGFTLIEAGGQQFFVRTVFIEKV